MAGAEGSNTLLSPIFPLSMVLVGAMGILTGNVVLGTLVVMCFGALGFWLSAKRRSVSTIGPGLITISRTGFVDERLGSGQIQWKHIAEARTHIVPRLGQMLGVQLWSDGGASIPAISPDYENAYSLRAIRGGPDLVVDLKGAKDGFEITEAIHILIEDARQNSSD